MAVLGDPGAVFTFAASTAALGPPRKPRRRLPYKCQVRGSAALLTQSD